MNVRDLLIALVRYAIKGGALDTGAIEQSLNSKKAATLYKVAKSHDMAHLVCYALEKNGISVDAEVWQLFTAEKEQACLRYQMIQADFDEICACLDGCEVDYMPLKGAIVRHLYPEPWMRTSCDIDILVHERDIDKAVGALVSERAYKTDYKKTYHDVSLYSPFGMHLELHHNIKENEPKYDGVLTQVWEFSHPEEGYRHAQTKEFLLFHLTAHAAYHFIHGGCGLRSVIDLYLLNACGYDKDKLDGLLEKAGLARFYSEIISLGKYWLDGKENVSQTALETEKYILLGGVYGTTKQSATAEQVKKGGRLKYFWSRLFMPYETLAVLYPVIKKHKILTPVCQVRRWFGALFKSKRIAKEIKNVTASNREDLEKTKKLLSDLGL